MRGSLMGSFQQSLGDIVYCSIYFWTEFRVGFAKAIEERKGELKMFVNDLGICEGDAFFKDGKEFLEFLV